MWLNHKLPFWTNQVLKFSARKNFGKIKKKLRKYVNFKF